MEFLLDQLWFDTDDDHVLDPTDDGLLPQIIATDDTLALFILDDSVTVAEGAFFNAQLAFTNDREWWGDGYLWGEHFGAHKASGEGVHNPFILEALLTASIRAVQDRYGITPSAPAEMLEPQLKMPAGVRQIR